MAKHDDLQTTALPRDLPPYAKVDWGGCSLRRFWICWNLDGVFRVAYDDAGFKNPDLAIIRAASLLGLFDIWSSKTYLAVHRLEAQE